MPQQLKKVIKPCIAFLLFVGIIFAVTGHIDRFLGSFGLAKINQLNEHYLEESFDKAFRGFLVLSAIKSGVAVLEGSEVGLGFNLEVGDIVQSIFDYVDTAWKTTLAAATVLGSRGDPGDRFGDHRMDAKFVTLVGSVVGEGSARRSLEMLHDVEGLDEVGTLVRELGGLA